LGARITPAGFLFGQTMLKPALKLNILICHPSYGGNGGIDSEHPHIREWAVETILKMRGDPRIGEVHTRTLGDTPVTMVRNRFFTLAKELGCHLVLSVDSDQSPNKHAGEPGFKSFWDAAFDFIYENYGKGPRMVVAPYVGPAENIYVFKWRAHNSRGIDSEFSLEQFTREEASVMAGIQECAAGPTGLYLMDTRLLDLIEPSPLSKWQVLEKVQSGEMTIEDGVWALREGYCYYEWKNQYADQKASTEDVTLTRDISLAGLETLGYNPLFCAWDSWIGHWKPKNLGKPERFSVEHVGASLRRAVLANQRANEACIDLDALNQGDKHFDALKKLAPATLERRTGLTEFKSNGHESNGVYHAPIAPPTPKITQHRWEPVASALNLVGRALVGKSVVVDIGPGHRPLVMATHFIGRKADGIDYPGEFHELNLEHDRLPFEDGSVDFVFCRHTVEDLKNPAHLLSEIRRIAKAGYIETPSPLAEATEGVNAPGSSIKGRGYPHHHSIVWSSNGVLNVLPKMPHWNDLDLPDGSAELNQMPEAWNAYHLWEGPLDYRILENTVDYLLGVDDRYTDIVRRAIEESNLDTFERLLPTGHELTTDTGRVTFGPWFVHGHAPATHCDALADIVRSKGYTKQRPVRILEVGSWLGKTAIAMADSSEHSRVFCIDTWAGTESDCTGPAAENAGGADMVYEKFLSNCGNRIDNTIFPFRRTSAEAAKMHWEPFDIIFIDGDHEYEGVKADILDWWPHLADDGVMIGHDFHVHQYDGVVQAVEEIFGAEKIEAFAFHPQGCMWKARKQDFPDLLEKFNGELATA
jgi:hypothetical protein